MSWYSSTYRQRLAISVPSAAGGTPKDIDVVVPVDLEAFWTAQTAAGDTAGTMLRVTAADGYTLQSYSVDDGAGGAWSTSARTGRIRIDGATMPGDAKEVALFWLYFDPIGVPTSAAVSTTIASALTGFIEQAGPAHRVVEVTGPRVGSQRPVTILQKTTTDEQVWWLQIDRILQPRRTRSAGRLVYEEPWAATILANAAGAGGVDVGTLHDYTKMRWIEAWHRGRRRLFLAVYVKAGSSGTNYTVLVTIRTIAPATALATRRVLDARVGLRVYDVLEAAT